MPAFQIQVQGLLDGTTPFVIPDPLPDASDGGVIKIDAGVGVDVGTFDLGALSTDNVPVWVRAYHVEVASGTRAVRSELNLQGSRQNQQLSPIASVPGGTLLTRPFVLNTNGIAPTGSILEVLTDSVGAAFSGAPVAGPHFVYFDLVPLTTDEQMTLVQDMEAFADAKARAQGEIYESFQAVAANLTVEPGLWVSPIGPDVSFNARSGQLQNARVSMGTAPNAGESMLISVQRITGVAAPITMATITVDDSFSGGDVVDIPLTHNNINLLTNDRVRILRTYVAGGGPAPMAETTVRFQIVPVRDPNS